MYLYFKNRVFKLIFRVLDVLKGLRVEPHQRGRLRALKNEVLRFWNGPYVRRFVYAYVGLCICMHEVSCVCTALMA